MKVGILSFQGSFLDHSKSIHELGYESLLIKQSKDLTSVDALILPGGESTAMKKINQFSNLLTLQIIYLFLHHLHLFFF